MPKVLRATCSNGVVRVGSLVVSGVRILSGGVGPSSGVLLLEGAVPDYVADTTPDLEATLAQVATALENIENALTTLGAAIPTATNPPALVPLVAAIATARASLTTLKGALR